MSATTTFAAAAAVLLTFATLGMVPGVQSQPRSVIEPLTDLDAPHSAWSEHPTISGDGRLVAFANRREPTKAFDLYLFDRRTRRLTQLPVQGPRTFVAEASLSPDGRFVVFPTSDPTGHHRVGLSLYDRTTARITAVPGLQAVLEPGAPTISGNGRFIGFVHVVQSGSGSRALVGLYDRSARALVPLPELNGDSPALDRDSRYIVFDQYGASPGLRRRLNVYDRRNARFLDLPGLNEAACNQSGHLTGDGRLLVFTIQGARPCETPTPAEIRLYDITRKMHVPLPGLDGHPGMRPAISLDGRFIAFMGLPDGEWRYRIYIYDRQR